MAISATKVIEDSFKAIIKSEGVGGESEQVLVDSFNLDGASSQPKVSIANLYYEVLGSGDVTIFFKNDEEKKVVIRGRGNYGLKPGESKIKDPTGDILLTSDSNVIAYNVIIETHKALGFN